MHSRAIQCKQAAYTSILTKVGNGRHVDVRAWAENITNAWLPIQMYGATSRAVTLILRYESKFPKIKSVVSTHSAYPCKNYLPRRSQPPCELIYFV